MVAEPEIALQGPFTESGEQEGGITNLYLTEDADASTDTETQEKDIAGLDEEDSLLAPLEGQVEFSYEGVFNAQRLFRASDNSSLTPQQAVIDWIFDFESLCLSGQGQGYFLVDNVNGYSVDPREDKFGVLVDEVEWEVSGGEGLRGEWRIELILSEGVQPAKFRNAAQAEESAKQIPSDSETRIILDGEDFPLGTVEDFKRTKNVDINAQKLVYNFDIPNVGIIESNPSGDLRVSGRITENQLSDRSLQDWAREFTSDVHGAKLQFQENFTLRRFEGAVSRTSTSFQSGSPNYCEWDLDFDVGSVTV